MHHATTIEVSAVDHIYVTVTDLERSLAFYDPVMKLLGFRKSTRPIAGEAHVHYFTDPDGIRLELVAPRRLRALIRDHWQELTEFEDPLTKAGLLR